MNVRKKAHHGFVQTAFPQYQSRFVLVPVADQHNAAVIAGNGQRPRNGEKLLVHRQPDLFRVPVHDIHYRSSVRLRHGSEHLCGHIRGQSVLHKIRRPLCGMDMVAHDGFHALPPSYNAAQQLFLEGKLVPDGGSGNLFIIIEQHTRMELQRVVRLPGAAFDFRTDADILHVITNHLEELLRLLVDAVEFLPELRNEVFIRRQIARPEVMGKQQRMSPPENEEWKHRERIRTRVHLVVEIPDGVLRVPDGKLIKQLQALDIVDIAVRLVVVIEANQLLHRRGLPVAECNQPVEQLPELRLAHDFHGCPAPGFGEQRQHHVSHGALVMDFGNAIQTERRLAEQDGGIVLQLLDVRPDPLNFFKLRLPELIDLE